MPVLGLYSFNNAYFEYQFQPCINYYLQFAGGVSCIFKSKQTSRLLQIQGHCFGGLQRLGLTQRQELVRM